MNPKGHGLIIEPLKPEDYIFGGSGNLGGTVLQPTGSWLQYLPDGERQAPFGFETNSCAAHGTLNALEILFKRVGLSVNYSDRHLAKTSNTDPLKGNTPKAVADAARKIGLVSQDIWPFDSSIETVEEFYADIPDNVAVIAATWPAEYLLNYEFVPTNPSSLKEALKYSPLGISVALWYEKDGIWSKPAGATDNHWVTLVDYEEGKHWLILDSYEPFLKKIAWDNQFMVAMRYAVTKKPESYGIEKYLNIIRKFFANLFPPVKAEDPKPVKDIAANLEKFCAAIRDHEGKPGDLNYRNNNAGNVRCSSQGYLEKYGNVKCVNNFAVFPTWEQGWLYLKNMCYQRVRNHKDWDFYKFFAVYAPSSDNNNPKHYAEVVAKRMGVPPTTKLSDLLL